MILDLAAGDVEGRLAVLDQAVGQDHAAGIDDRRLRDLPGEAENQRLVLPDQGPLDAEIRVEERGPRPLRLLDQLPERLRALVPVVRAEQLLGPLPSRAAVERVREGALGAGRGGAEAAGLALQRE